MRKISILIVDDHLLIREAWALLLSADERFAIAGSCESGEEAVRLARQLRPDVVIMDINLEGMNGFDATASIRKFVPGTSILAVSMHAQPCYAQKMMKMGALGFVTKGSSAEEMFKAIIEVDKKRKYICKEIKQIISEKAFAGESIAPKTTSLSFREMEIIDHLKMGHSSREIAGMLKLSAKTIDAHRYNILKKLNVKNTAALVNQVHNI